jgi:hypothetical protein
MRWLFFLMVLTTAAAAQPGPPAPQFTPITIDKDKYQQIDEAVKNLIAFYASPASAHAAYITWEQMWQRLEQQAQSEEMIRRKPPPPPEPPVPPGPPPATSVPDAARPGETPRVSGRDGR